jgi:hypothetical protein
MNAKIKNLLLLKNDREFSAPLAQIIQLVKQKSKLGGTGTFLAENKPADIFATYSSDFLKFSKITPWYAARMFNYSDNDIKQLKELGFDVKETNSVYEYDSKWMDAVAKSKQTKWFSSKLKYPGLAEKIQKFFNKPKVHTIFWD